GITMDPAKVEAIIKWPRPTSVTENLVLAPVLTLPSGSDGFQIYSDASKKGLGCVLMQHGKVIAYASRQLKPYEEIIRDLERLGIELYVSGQHGYWASLRIKPDLISQIKGAQKEDSEIWTIVENLNKQVEFHLDDDNVLWQDTRLVVPNDATLREALLTEAHSSPFSVHPGSTKMYHDLKQYFWWSGMKRDVATFVSKCLICQQVKIEHQRASGLLQQLDIHVWKWDEISMDFVTGLGSLQDRRLFVLCMSYTDVSQVANAACNYEILHERDDEDTERPDKRQRSGDRHQPTSQQSSHRSHGHNNDRHGSDRRGGNDNHRGSNNNNYSGSNNRNSGNGRDQRNRGHQSNRSTNYAPVDAENWISHMEKIFDVLGCEDAFKTRLAVYKFEGNALAWWKAYKQAKGGDAWLITVTWADFKKLFFLQFFPRAEQERLKREYHSILQMNTETSTEFMQLFLRLAGFLGAAAGTEEEQAKNFQWG
nr:putative reverse transcriptase domain-containing protein [Tanacetum cinerariifolium]